MLLVRDVMRREVKTIDQSSSVHDAASLMAHETVGSLIVTGRSGAVGIITEGDVSRAVAKGRNLKKTPVKSIMGAPLVSVTGEARVEEAAKLMARVGVKKLPVVDNDELVGIVTQSDIVASTFDLVTSLKDMVRLRYISRDFRP